MRLKLLVQICFAFLVTLLVSTTPALAQDSGSSGKLRIHVSPKQAYAFVDGKAIRDGSQTIGLASGTHKIGVYNYGYLPKVQDVQIVSGKTSELSVSLQQSGDKGTWPIRRYRIQGSSARRGSAQRYDARLLRPR